MEKKFCTNCGNTLTDFEKRKGKCFYCSQRRASIGTLIFGILVAIFFFVYGIVSASLNTDFYDEFNVALMFYYWTIGFVCLVGYWIVYTLFTKLDAIISCLKEK